jgi:hypothetical protein
MLNFFLQDETHPQLSPATSLCIYWIYDSLCCCLWSGTNSKYMNTIINILAVIGGLTVVCLIGVIIFGWNAIMLDDKERLTKHEKQR